MTTVITAAATAFTDSGELDLASTARGFEHAIDGNVDALFVNGTTGEFPALDRAERRAVLETAVRVAGAGRVVAHVGAADPHTVGLLARDAAELGVTRASVLTPFYLPASLDGVRRQVAAARSALPGEALFLYVFPDRTGVTMTPEDSAAIIEEFDLAGVKISIAGVEYLAAVRAALRSDRELLSGNDGLMREVAAAGGAGVVSGVSSALPRPFTDLRDALEQGRATAEAAARVAEAVPVLGPSLSNLKFAIARQGLFASPRMRMAVDDPSPAVRDQIVRLVESHARV